MKDATAPVLEPTPHGPAVLPSTRKPGWGRRAGLVGIILLISVGIFWALKRSKAVKQSPAATVAAVRTARVGSGNLIRSIRLTGVTGAQNFASLIAPQMQGSRRSPNSNISTRLSMPQAAVKAPPSAGASGSPSPTAGGSDGGGGLATGVRNMLNRFTAPRSGGGSASSRTSSDSGASGATAQSGTGSGGGFGGGGGGGMGGNGGMNASLTLERLVPPGSRVKKGQVIAEFDRQYMLLRLDDYVANQQQVDAALVALKTNIEVDREAHRQLINVAKANLDKALLDLRTVPVQSAIVAEKLKMNADEAEATYKQVVAEEKVRESSRQAQLRIAEIESQQSKLELQKAQTNADKMLIRAPMDGITVMSNLFRGGQFEQVAQGDTLHRGMMYLKVVDTSSMVVNATVNQADVELLRVGAKAKVRFDAYPDLELPARLYSVGAMAKTGNVRGSYVKEVPVIFKLDGIDPRVIPDLSVSIDVILDQQEEAALIPLHSVFREAGSDRTFVFVQNGADWVKREVALGVASNIEVAVKSGVRPGEVVAVEWPIRKQGSTT